MDVTTWLNKQLGHCSCWEGRGQVRQFVLWLLLLLTQKKNVSMGVMKLSCKLRSIHFNPFTPTVSYGDSNF